MLNFGDPALNGVELLDRPQRHIRLGALAFAFALLLGRRRLGGLFELATGMIPAPDPGPIPGVQIFRSGQKRGVNTRTLKRELKRRSAFEAVIDT